jgi:hypothetical protein
MRVCRLSWGLGLRGRLGRGRACHRICMLLKLWGLVGLPLLCPPALLPAPSLLLPIGRRVPLLIQLLLVVMLLPGRLLICSWVPVLPLLLLRLLLLLLAAPLLLIRTGVPLLLLLSWLSLTLVMPACTQPLVPGRMVCRFACGGRLRVLRRCMGLPLVLRRC